MKLYTLLFAIALSLFSCTAESEKSADKKPTKKQTESPETQSKSTSTEVPAVKMIWEAKEGLKTPESVCYNSVDQYLFVSNINGKPTEKNGNGFISIISLDGVVKKPTWVTGLDAPKGMGIHKGKLYVSDIDQLIEIDIATASISNRYSGEGASFLNDIAIGKDGAVYVTDSNGSKIYRLSGGKLSIWIEDEALVNPNGLFMHKGNLLCGISDNVVSIDLSNKKVTPFIKKIATGNITDGLVAHGENGFFTSNWQGAVFYIKEGKQGSALLFDNTKEKINAADLEYVPRFNLLAVPTFFDNRILGYTVQ